MAVLQSVYASTIPAGFPGMVFNGETSNRISRTVEDATAIPFGRFVYRGTGDHGCTATPTAGATLGVTIVNEGGGTLTLGSSSDVGYSQYGTAGIMTKGVIWVTSSVAVAKGDQAYVTSAGFITNVASGSVIAPNWFFDNTIAAAGLVRLANRV